MYGTVQVAFIFLCIWGNLFVYYNKITGKTDNLIVLLNCTPSLSQFIILHLLPPQTC